MAAGLGVMSTLGASSGYGPVLQSLVVLDAGMGFGMGIDDEMPERLADLVLRGPSTRPCPRNKQTDLDVSNEAPQVSDG